MKNYPACKEIILIPIGKSCFLVSAHIPDKQEKSILIIHQTKTIHCMQKQCRDQARGRLGRNSRPRGRNFALNGTQGEVGVSLKKKKKIFFLGRLIFILSPHKCKLW